MSARPVRPSVRETDPAEKTHLCVIPLEDRVVPAGQVVGTVFLDFNANGLLDSASTLANNGSGTVAIPGDTGVAGVVVTAFDPANAIQGVATSAANGQYTLALANTGPYRLEFTNLPAGTFYGPQGSGVAAVQSGTGVQFVPDNPPATAVNLSVVKPEFITPDNPLLVSNTYVIGAYNGPNAGSVVISSFPYTSGASTSETNFGGLTPYANPTTHALAVTQSQVGATWGLAYDDASNRVFASAFTKRHDGYGPNGPGAIYAMNAPSAANPTVTTASVFVDLNALTGNAAAGVDFRGGGGGGYDYATDQGDIGWNAVGKTGLGGLAVDDTGTYLYTVGLADRKLYRIRIPADGSVPTAGDVTAFNIPLPTGANGVTGIGGVGGALGDLRPFAVQFYNGMIYVGAVNSAESTGLSSDLRAFVFAFDPTASGGTGAFVNLGGGLTSNQAVFTTQLDYNRGFVHPGDVAGPVPAEWLAWSATRQTVANPGERYGIYPQPELTGLAFDANGNMTLGLRDRAGDQFGRLLTTDFAGRPLTLGITGGDTLAATITTPGNLGSGWTLESGGTALGNTTGGSANAQGPGGGEYYFQDDLPRTAGGEYHQEVSTGGLLQLPGRTDLLVGAFDPIRNSDAAQFGSNGIRWYNNATGVNSKTYLLAFDSANGFGKSGGIGDLIAVTARGREVGNRIWNDANQNGRQDADELGIQNVQVILASVTGGGAVTPLATATTDAAGNYYFSGYSGTDAASKKFGIAALNVAPPVGSTYRVLVPVSNGPLAGYSLSPFQAAGTNAQNNSDGVTVGANYVVQNVATNRLGSAEHGNDIGFFLAPPGQLSGFVYEDVNDSKSRTPGTDNPIAGATVVLTGTVTAGGAAVTPLTTTTDASGFYSFTNLAPGSYTVTETQPAGYLDSLDQIGSTSGVVGNDVLSAIPLVSNANSQNNNFGEVLPTQLSGFVYHDITNDGTFNAGDAPIPGVTLVLTGVDDLGATITPRTTTTDGTGAYAFTALRPGSYSVAEAQPAGFNNRTNNPGTVTNGTPGTVSGDNIVNVVERSGANSPNNNFGEIQNAQLSGFVYEDVNDSKSRTPGTDNPIAGATVVLTGTVTAGGAAVTPLTTTTDASGFYSFTNLAPGSYTVTETQPAGYLDSLDQIGSTSGVVGNDVLSAIPLVSNANSQNNNFGEVLPAQLSGFVYQDNQPNDVRDGADTPLAGVTLTLTGVDDLGATITPRTTTTDGTGAYAFTALRPGTYSVSEAQPPNLTTRTNTPGAVFAPGTGTAGTAVGDVIQNVVLNSNANNPNNNFGEVPTDNAQLSGFVYEDRDNSKSRTPGTDNPIAGATVVLTGTRTAGGSAITPLTTTTDANGFYSFTTLAPGTYTVTETQPAGYLDSLDQIGSTSGVVGNDVLSAIPLVSNANSQNNNFGEVRPVQLSGFVYQDNQPNDVKDGADTPLSGVTLTLTGVDDQGTVVAPAAAVTDGNGFYQFLSLRPGTYTVTETQPAGYVSRTNTAGPITAGIGIPGTVSGDNIQYVTLLSGANSPENNFGEVVPVVLNEGSISGFVYQDDNINGGQQANERGLAGWVVALYREEAGGGLTQLSVAQTGSNGFYEFTGLAPGTYRVVETQKPRVYSTIDAAGSTGGTAPRNNTIIGIPLAANQKSIRNDFGELPPTNIYGYVWVDANRNGNYDPGEQVIPNATVTISGTAFAGSPIATTLTPGLANSSFTVTTDSNGYYEYRTLPPGNYSLVQTNTPAGFSDFASQNLSGRSIQTSSTTSFGGIAAPPGQAQGAINFGKVNGGNTVSQTDPSKLNFLGSSAAVNSGAANVNPLVGPATFQVNTAPPFAIGTGGTAPALIAVGAGAGFAPTVRVFDYASQAEVFRFNAFEDTMTAGVRVTTGDVTGDGVPDVIAVAGPGGGPRVRVFDGVTGNAFRDFYAFPPQFRGGLYVAVADFNKDGKADILVGAGEGGGPNVRVFDGATGTILTSFYAFDSTQTGGARIAVGDFDGDGTPDIAASNGPGNTSLIRIFSGKGFGQIAQYVPYNAAYTGGVFLTAGDFNKDGRDELVTGADQGGGPNVRVFDALSGNLRSSFFAYGSDFTGGVRVTAKDLNGDGIADIFTGAGIGGASRLRVFSGATLQPLEEFYAFDSGVRTGVFVG